MPRKRNSKVSAQFQLLHDAEKIADIVFKTDMENRGDLLQSVGTILTLKAQNYTSLVFLRAARDYGLKET